MSTIELNRATLKKCFLPLVFAITTGTSQIAMADIYSYVDKDGTLWLTNTTVKGKNAKLIARTPKKKQAPAAASASGGTTASAGSGRVNSCMRLSHAQVEQRTAPYMDAIAKYASRYNVEENLVRAVIRQESCFNKDARSHVGAHGLMQLMPGTADMMGVDNSADPHQNIQGGAKYLSRQLDNFGGDKQLALAAYNAGPGAVNKYGGIPPYRETQDYVVKVMAEYKRLEKRQKQTSYIRSAAEMLPEGITRSE